PAHSEATGKFRWPFFVVRESRLTQGTLALGDYKFLQRAQRTQRAPALYYQHFTRSSTKSNVHPNVHHVHNFNDLQAQSRVGSFALSRGGQSEILHHSLQVLPSFFLLSRIAQQVGGMVGDDQPGVAKIIGAAPEIGHAVIDLQQALRRNGTERHDDLWSHHIDLPQQEWRASLAFITLGSAVARR